jgi:hypothetical protein
MILGVGRSYLLSGLAWPASACYGSGLSVTETPPMKEA